MSDLGRLKQALILAALLGVLIVFSVRARGATAGGEILVDPTLPLTAGNAAEVDATLQGNLLSGFRNYQLSSILIRPNLRLAVINSMQAGIGDRIGNARVTAIESDRVTLEINGETEVLELYRNSIRTETTQDDEG